MTLLLLWQNLQIMLLVNGLQLIFILCHALCDSLA